MKFLTIITALYATATVAVPLVNNHDVGTALFARAGHGSAAGNTHWYSKLNPKTMWNNHKTKSGDKKIASFEKKIDRGNSKIAKIEDKRVKAEWEGHRHRASALERKKNSVAKKNDKTQAKLDKTRAKMPGGNKFGQQTNAFKPVAQGNSAPAPANRPQNVNPDTYAAAMKAMKEGLGAL